MIRASFLADPDNYAPDPHPKHPYWYVGELWGRVTGDREYHAMMIAYADDLEDLLRVWPDAADVKIEEVWGYVFTKKHPKPDWFSE